MANHPQNSPRGLFTKQAIKVGSQTLTYNSTALLLDGGIQLSDVSTAVFTADSTGNLAAAAGLKLSGVSTLLTANSTAVVSSVAQLTLNSMNLRLTSNSTGTALQVNTTDTTWLYVSTTSTDPR